MSPTVSQFLEGFGPVTDVGAQLRMAREQAGVSLSGMAKRTTFSKSYLGNVETGGKRPSAGVVQAYARVLGEEMNRRGLLTGLTASVVAPAAVAELLREGFTAALSERKPDDWVARVDDYGQRYMSAGAAEIQQQLARDLVVVQQHLERPVMWGAAAKMLTTYGKTTTSRAEAVRWYRLAAMAADRSEDAETRVWVRGRSALALAYEAAELPTASRMADHALAIDSRPSLGRLNALVAKAHVAGVRGDRETALRTLDDAKRVFDVAGSSEQVSDFAVPEWRFHTFASMLLSRLGDPGAVAEQDAADRSRPATLPRFATHIQLHRGLMLAKAGDTAGGLAYARAALGALPPERHSLSLKLMMREIEKVAV